MTSAELAAYVGAAAWLPQIGKWIFEAYAKPKLKLISAPTVTVSYGNMGPVVHMTTSISADRKDAVIEKMTLKVLHEKGEERQLTWQWLDETFSQIRSGTGETAEVSKQVPAIALKVSTLSLAERRIGFSDLEYQSGSQEMSAKLIDHHKYLSQNPSINAVDALITSRDFNEARDFFVGSMYWKEGKYTFEINIHEVRRRSPHVERFEVCFTKADVERLRENTEHLEKLTRHSFASTDEEVANNPSPFWNWVTLRIQSVAK